MYTELHWLIHTELRYIIVSKVLAIKFKIKSIQRHGVPLRTVVLCYTSSSSSFPSTTYGNAVVSDLTVPHRRNGIIVKNHFINKRFQSRNP